jgi:clan AA aspartic protease (TIGR02281 family)
MNLRIWLSCLAILLVFAGGCLFGWWWRDSGPGKVTPVDDSTLTRQVTSEPPVTTRFTRLLDEARFGEAITILTAVPNPQQDQQHAQVLELMASLLASGQCDVQQQLLDAYTAKITMGPDELILQARCLMVQEHYAAVIDALYEAAILATGDEWLPEIRSLIRQAVDAQDELLRTQGQWLTLDYFYQSLLVQDPGNAGYYQQLASVRRDSGDLDGAVNALLQIQYDPQLGEAARQQLENLQEEMARVHQQARIIPLQGEGVRLIVPVRLDDAQELRLLVDTGAALSVIQPHILTAMGYRLAAGLSSTFQTANGEINAPVVRVDSLAIEDLTQSDLQIGSLALELGDSVDGLLGMNYLQHYQFSIDYQARLLYLAPRH